MSGRLGRINRRKAIAAAVIFGVIAMGAPAAASTTTTRIKDRRGDAPGRSDVAAMTATRSDTALVLGFRPTTWSSPLNSSWQYSPYTFARWRIDTDNDGIADFSADYFNNGRDRMRVAVYRGGAGRGTPVCTGRASRRDGAHFARIPSSCLGDPAALRLTLRFQYDLRPSNPGRVVGSDTVPNAGWSPRLLDPVPAVATYARIGDLPQVISSGETLQITGSLERQPDSAMLSGMPLQLLHRGPTTGGWSVLEEATTAADGTVTFATAPKHNGQYLIHHPGTANTLPHSSGIGSIGVAFRITTTPLMDTVEPYEPVFVTGTVKPGWPYLDYFIPERELAAETRIGTGPWTPVAVYGDEEDGDRNTGAFELGIATPCVEEPTVMQYRVWARDNEGWNEDAAGPVHEVTLAPIRQIYC